MASKTTLVATFANGDFIYRMTALELRFAWRVTTENPKYGRSHQTGFSGRRDLAEKAARACLSMSNDKIEIVATVEHDTKAWKAELVRRQPFRIKYTYRDGRSYHIGGDGNQDARWATREAAEACLADYVATNRDGTTYALVDDSTPAPAARKGKAKKSDGFRIKRRWTSPGPHLWHFVKNGRSHQRFETREAAEAWIAKDKGGIATYQIV